jgi:hypothetical protein
VKKTFKIASVTFLMVIYCLAIGVVTESRVYSEYNKSSTSSQEKFISDLSTKILQHTAQSESATNNLNNLPLPSSKSHFQGFDVLIAIEQLFKGEFSQYTNFSKNILVKHRKADFIFPFHYFW